MLGELELTFSLQAFGLNQTWRQARFGAANSEDIKGTAGAHQNSGEHN